MLKLRQGWRWFCRLSYGRVMGEIEPFVSLLIWLSLTVWSVVALWRTDLVLGIAGIAIVPAVTAAIVVLLAWVNSRMSEAIWAGSPGYERRRREAFEAEGDS
jgi:hypothetical protein